ncbi:MAG: PSD1 domain-containing protein [Verrucomicrobiales bacterium]|nr:PSD1 domain-containing protein [Verrucomicrobiales bacterium]
MNSSRHSIPGLLLLLLSAGLAPTLNASEPTSDQLAFFEAKVRPLLVKHCYECHSTEAEKVKGGLLIDSKAGWMAGGDSGEAIEPGKPAESLLMETVRYGNPDLQMPPKYQLSEAEIAVLEDWIAMGAPDPRTGPAVAKAAGIDWEKGRSHWAFLPVARPEPPAVKAAEWVRDDLDRFILAGIEAAGLQPVADADRFALIRRVTLDLTGLPPTVDEVGAFVRDPDPDDAALAKVVDRLLKSPAFGERWGRHWLDVARYADSVGKTRNVPFPYAWRYRNYVIDAFNADKPYDEFLAEQVAGDLLEARDAKDRAENLVASGFLALGSMDLNERDNEQFTLDRIDDQMDTLGRATMGLTLGCARCHDHKFDPIAQTDYYALAGVFASTQTLSGQQNRQGGNKDYHQVGLLARLDAGGDAPKTPAAGQAAEISRLTDRMRQLVAEGKKKNLSKDRRAELRREVADIRKTLAELGGPDVGPGSDAGKKKKKKGAGDGPVDPNAAYAMALSDGAATDLALRVRGEPDIKGDLVPRGFPTILKPATPVTLPEAGSGRRELAAWLTAPEHPLTARVMVNRIWAHLMGRGLVETVDNFGASGAAPTHPELLDHLAGRFVDGGWSMKAMIRTIVLSRTYRLGSDQPASHVAADEGNRLYWRANLRRLEAEAIRDSLLAAGGMLAPGRPDGAPFDASVGGDLAKTNPGKRGGAKAGDPIARPERSVYLPVFRSRLPGMFTVFDFAEPDQVNGQRDVTTVAPQALFLLNNPFVVDVSRRAAERILEQELPDETARVRHAYAYTLCRYPTEAETERALAFLGAEPDRETGWTALVQALYSAAEFRYVP